MSANSWEMDSEVCQEILARHGSTGDALLACQELSHALSPRRLADSDEDSFASFNDAQDWIDLGISILCVVGAALAAGLTMATVGLRRDTLMVVARTGSPAQKKAVASLLPLITQKSHHRLLVTLLLVNSVFNETLPLFLDNLG